MPAILKLSEVTFFGQNLKMAQISKRQFLGPLFPKTFYAYLLKVLESKK